MGLAEAREALAKRKSGHETKTLQAAFDDYYEHLTTQFRDPSQVQRMFDRDVLPKRSHRSVEEITKAQWGEVLQAVVDRGSPVMANRLLTQLKRFLAFCLDRGWVDENPLEKVARKNIGGKEKAKDRHLTLDEIEAFLQKIQTLNISEGTQWALVGCLLTGQRASEVLGVTKDGKTDTKMGRLHQLPMTRYVRFWLSKRPKDMPRDHRVLSHALRRAGCTFTPHDLRRTYASRLADQGVAPHVIEKLLDHKMVGVMAVYNRADYWPERMAAQRLWDNTLRKVRQKIAPEPKLDGAKSLGRDKEERRR